MGSGFIRGIWFFRLALTEAPLRQLALTALIAVHLLNGHIIQSVKCRALLTAGQKVAP